MITRREFLKGSAMLFASAAIGTTLTGCGTSASASGNTVVIYSSNEGERNETIMTALRKDLPNLDVRLKYMGTSNLAARLKIEGEKADCDMVIGVEAGYLVAAKNALIPLNSHFDLNVFEDDLRIDDTIMPFTRECGSFAYNTEVIEKLGIEPPKDVYDLLDSRFKGKITMPNPKSSATGYNFYYSMVNLLGEKDALEYFDKFAENVYQFTSSGGAPASALTRGEAAVGYSLMFQLVNEKNDGAPIKLLIPEHGAPWTMNGLAVVKGREQREEVWTVAKWFYEKGILLDKQEYVPDKVYKNQNTKIAGYPENYKYADMKDLFETERKERLLNAWKY